MEDKTTLRLIAKRVCKQIEDKYQASIGLLNVLKPMLDQYCNISIYNAFGHEINLSHVINYLTDSHKNIYQPIAYRSSKIMRFELLHAGSEHSIFYPENNKIENEMRWQDLDLIIMPLLAVDKFGTRLGKGGGYYDATLEGIEHLANPPILIGVGFNCQFSDTTLPRDKWDITLNYFASEIKLIKF